MNSMKIEQHLQNLRTQRDKASAQLEASRSELARVQTAFNDGGGVDALTAATATVAAIEAAVGRLDSEICHAESALTVAQREERRADGLQVLCGLAQRGAETHGAYLLALSQAQAGIEQLANNVRRTLAAHQDVRWEFRVALSATPATKSDLLAAGADDLTGIGVSLGGVSIPPFDAGYTLPTSPFDGVLQGAMNLATTRDPAIIAQNQAESDERARLRRDEAEYNARLAKQRADEEAAEAERLEAEEAIVAARHAKLLADERAGRAHVFI